MKALIHTQLALCLLSASLIAFAIGRHTAPVDLERAIMREADEPSYLGCNLLTVYGAHLAGDDRALAEILGAYSSEAESH